MEKNHQDRTNHKPVATEDKIWLPPSYINKKPVSPVPKRREMSWGFADKSFWEWLLLLGTLLAALGAIAIPFVVTIIGLNYTQQQAQSNLQIAQDQQRAAILQTYLDDMQDLLLNHNLLKSKPDEAVAVLARARTLTALQGLDADAERKGHLLIFPYQAHLIGFGESIPVRRQPILHTAIIDLSGADLRSADLSGIDLLGVNLSGADLLGADLNDVHLGLADLSFTNFSRATLTSVTFNGATLIGATLTSATLNGVVFYNADLSSADLSHATGITTKELEKQTKLLLGTILPDGTTHSNIYIAPSSN